jgi:hypothetical protein
MFGTEDQKARFLRPLVAGDMRSFFVMTEPEVTGSDPTLLRARAVRDGEEWVLDGHKWFSSGADGARVRDRLRDQRPGGGAAPPRDHAARPGGCARGRGRPTRACARARGARVEHALRGAVHGRPRAGREHARRGGQGVPARPEAARPGAHQPCDALARADAACIRADVPLRERAGGLRRPAGRQADSAELVRRLGGRDSGVPSADDGRCAEDRPGVRGARRGLAPQGVRGTCALRGDRPSGAGARRPRAHGRDAARPDGAQRARGADLRRARRGAPRDRGASNPQLVPGRRRLGVLPTPARRAARREVGAGRPPVSDTESCQERGVPVVCQSLHTA